MEKLETNFGRPRGFPLPSPIIQVIFSKLPVSNLPACRLVCKTWNRLVLDYANYSSSSKLFPIPHAFLLFNADFNPYYVNFESSLFCNPKMHCIDIDTLSSVASFGFDGGWADISIINSCNGLLFVVKGTYYIWCKGILNPMTNEFFKLPGSELEGDIYVYGFGFVPRTKQYKLFRVFTDETGSTDMMEVFTFGRRGTNHNHWRHVSLPFPITLHHCGAYFDGVIYWIGREKENDFVIYALDVETEKIKLNAVLEVGPYPKRARLQPFNGTIYAIIFMDSPCNKIQVWRMRGKDSWIRDFVISDIPMAKVRLFHLVAAFEDREILFLLNDDFFCLDKAGRKIKIKSFNPNPNARQVTGACHIDSLNFGSLSNMLAGYN